MDMKTTHRCRFEMLARVREFGVNFGHLFPGATRAQALFGRVSDIVGQLEKWDLAEIAASGTARAKKKAVARDALVALLTRLDASARVMGGESPQLDARFQRGRVGDHALLTVARQFAGECDAHADEFVAHGVPPTFRTDLDQRIAGLDAALRERHSGREEQVAARQQIAALIEEGLAAVRTLDLMVTNVLEADPVTRAVWQRDRRLTYPRTRKRAQGETEAPPAPAQVEPAA
jgi:hypothetical protein